MVRCGVLVCVWLLVLLPRSASAQEASLLWPSIPFGAQDTVLGREALALTFDDGPGSFETNNTTQRILDILLREGVQATFFLCGGTFESLSSDPLIKHVLERMRLEGHDIGNHTYTHARSRDLSIENLQDDLTRNEQFVFETLGKPIPLSLYRMPYGMPFYGEDEDAHRVAPVTAHFGVHVGWGIDSGDWKCLRDGGGATCIVETVKKEIDAGHRGPLLMHSLYEGSAQALDQLLPYFRQQGIRIVSVEEMVYARYGMPSQSLRQQALSASHVEQDVGADAHRQSRMHPPWPVSY